jgi:flagellar motor protein MotB
MIQIKHNQYLKRVVSFNRLAAFAACVAIFFNGCAHDVSVISEPGDASVYSMNADSTKGVLIGQTPITFKGQALAEGNGIVVEKPGFETALLYVPTGKDASLSLRVALRPLDKAWVERLPKEVAAKLQSDVLSDLLQFQAELFSRPPEQLKLRIATLQTKYGHLSAFHYLIGTYHFYREDFALAAESFSRAVELDPTSSPSKDMLHVNQLRAVESSRAGRVQAFEALGAAAKRIASNAAGVVAPTRSHPSLPDPDGLRIVLPSDAVFVPASSKVKPEGAKILQMVAKELQNLTRGFAVQIGVHTDEDPRSEFVLDKPIAFKGKKTSQLPWQLSGERAAAVMLYLRAQGVLAQNWAIAGYGDSEPLLIESAEAGQDVQRSGLNRRIELQISFYKGPKEKPFSDKELEMLKKSLEVFMVENAQDSGATGAGSVPNGAGGNSPSQPQRARDAKSKPEAATSGQVTASPEGDLSAEELQKRRKTLETKLKKPAGRGAGSDSKTSAEDPGKQRFSAQPLDVPLPKVPKLNK